MYSLVLTSLLLASTFIHVSTTSERKVNVSTVPTNELGLTFGHTEYKRDDAVLIYFNVSNSTLKEYQYYYFDFRPFGSLDHHEYLPRQRLKDTHNSLRIIRLHEGDYVSCVSFIDEYETIFKPRYACYEFTLGEKIVGSHHGGKPNYLAPLLVIVAFVLHVIIAVVHHIKSNNYAHKLLHRFIDVSSKPNRRNISIDHSLKELDRELDHPHIPASVQRRLSRVTIDVGNENDSNHRENFLTDVANDELPLYTIPHHHKRLSLVTMDAIPENGNTNTMDSLLSMKHLMDSTPWIKRANR